MQTATWGVAAGALLLLATGGAKLRSPGPTANALLLLRFGWRRPVAVALGLAEIVVGIAAVTLPGPVPAACVAALYLGFGAYVVAGLRSPGASSCGCSGHDDTPVTPLHLLVNTVLAATALAAAVAGAGPLLALPAGSLLAGAALAGLAAGVGWLAVTVHPQLVAARASLRTR